MRFSMCSLYPENKRALCACFQGKGESVVKDMVALHSDVLLWAGAGSGVLSLADLERELKGKRFWHPEGKTDLEFLESCHQRGILVFAVVFTAQGYQVAVELNSDESEIVSFGKISGKGKAGTWGLNEFYQERYLRLYPSFKKYFSQERLTLIEKFLAQGDFLEQSACRDLEGKKSLCYWVTSSGLEDDLQYTNYFMCKNSPLWKEHLKTIIEMQIDAGFDGIQFDEPAIAMEPGGTRAGFCEHCQRKFREYLMEQYGQEFKNFDYSALLKKKGAGIPSELCYFKGLPLWQDWKRFSLKNARENFAELAYYARAYAQIRGKEVQLASNFAFWMPHHLALAEYVDVFSLEYHPAIPPENSGILYTLIGRALTPEKPVTLVPHIGFSAFLRKRSQEKKSDGSGKDSNLLKYLIAEASFAGSDFMVPYSCLCLTGESPYFPPVKEIAGYLKFVKELEQKFPSRKILSQATIVLSFPSYFWSFDFLNLPGRHLRSLNSLIHLLQARAISYRVIIWGDDEFLKDQGELSPEGKLILPEVSHITDAQLEKLESFFQKGGSALVLGQFATHNTRNEKRKAMPFSLKSLPGIIHLPSGGIKAEQLAQMGLKPQVWLEPSVESGSPWLRLEETNGRLLIKILNRNYHYLEDFFVPIRNARLMIEKEFRKKPQGFLMHTPEEKIYELKPEEEENHFWFLLPEFYIYSYLEEQV